MINPGTLPLDEATEQAAAANITAFVEAVRARGGTVTGQPQRDPATDRDGRFGYQLRLPNTVVVSILMPGVSIARVRDDRTASAPCLYVNGLAWWWNDAVGQVAGPTKPRPTNSGATG